MSGPFPTEFGQLKQLRHAQLHQPYTHKLVFMSSKNCAWGPYSSEAEPYKSFEAGLASLTA